MHFLCIPLTNQRQKLCSSEPRISSSSRHQVGPKFPSSTTNVPSKSDDNVNNVGTVANTSPCNCKTSGKPSLRAWNWGLARRKNKSEEKEGEMVERHALKLGTDQSTSLQAKLATSGYSDSSTTLAGSMTEDPNLIVKKYDHPHSTTGTTERLSELRALMRKYSLDYYLVPSEDAHNGEYIADSDQRRRFISGFTGSAGIAIITLHSAFLSTDSRFWIQAREELDHNWIVVKSSYDWTGFLVDHITGGPKGTRIGVDGRLVTYSNVTYIQSKITNHKSELVFLDENLVDVIWKDRPSEPREPLFVHDLVYAGEPASSKLRRLRERVREDMTDSSNTATIITHLPSIAWLLNLRGSGIPYNPLFHAYLYISLDKHNEETILFLDSSQAPPDIQTYLTNLHVERMGYDEIWNFLSSKTDKTIIITPKTSYAISSQIPQEKCIVLPSFAEELLSRKNSMEVDSLRKAYLKDGIAFTQFLAWLDSKLVSENEDVTEFEAAERLTEFRKTQGKGTYRDQKEPISASGPNAALPHYVAKRDTARVIDRNLPYLNDSGGQYLEGTCDTTRTVHLGTPDQAMSEAYTRVLQGHIAISTAIFPIGTSGDQLDALARRPLWKNGLDYGHGTGHGFGTFLTVHEGIQSFSSNVPLVPGHVLTVEPGCYKEGKWGVRIESALVVTKANVPGIDQENWLQFERLTVVPIHTRMVKWSMLTREEKVWLEEHNQKCYEALAPHLKNDKQTLRWLRREVGVSDVD